MTLLPLAEAQARVLAQVKALPSVVVPLGEARGLVLAQDVTAKENIPPFANTGMDGFAVKAADTAGATSSNPVALAVAGTIAAGAVADRPLNHGEAMRIMTGAPLPDGADAVIMVELTSPDPSGDDRIVLCTAEVQVGNHVRPAGDDLLAGDLVFRPGEVLSPAHIGMLATLGYYDVKVIQRPRVGVFSTGDELVIGAEPLGPGQIRDSNRPQLLALVAEAGLEPIDLGWLPDDEVMIESALREAAERCDALVTSGGVSMGDFDFVKAILQRLGEMNWMQIAIKPAKPFAFGTVLETPIFGLPGNPVSSAVSFELLARPALLAMMGRPDTQRRHVWAMADEPMPRKADGKTHFVRVTVSESIDGAPRIRSAGNQGSHQLSGLANANGLAAIPDGDGLATGDRVNVLLL
ncbi:MAG: molybdopterin molybdotransferase MoeA [Acidimicrobiales bacterium]|nr:molybdopterin molybdotransferase MoeA [Acidimicrobiales bacterium]